MISLTKGLVAAAD